MQRRTTMEMRRLAGVLVASSSLLGVPVAGGPAAAQSKAAGALQAEVRADFDGDGHTTSPPTPHRPTGGLQRPGHPPSAVAGR